MILGVWHDVLKRFDLDSLGLIRGAEGHKMQKLTSASKRPLR